jgi:hypothetical protein
LGGLFEIMTDPSDIEPSNPTADKPPKRNWEAVRTERFIDLKFSHYIEIILTLALVGIAYLQYAVYTRQAAIMDTQTRILKVDKRPWIKVTPAVSGRLAFFEWNHQKGISVPLQFILKNYGESPAVNVIVRAHIVEHPGNPKRSELGGPQEQACEMARSDAKEKPLGGTAIFPNEPGSIEQVIGTNGVYKTKSRVSFAVVGCAIYMFSETEVGETGFRMMLGQDVGGQIVGLPFVDGPQQPYREPIPPELLGTSYPVDPPNVGYLRPSDAVFRPEDEGNYAR